MSFELVARMMELVGDTPAGSTVSVPVDGPSAVDVVAGWCASTGNTVLAVHADSVEVLRGRVDDPLDALPPEMLPGYRLWVYTNFHCNLACDYCCVESSPRADKRIVTLGEFTDLVDEATSVGVAELYLTGGEPFLLTDMAERLCHAASLLPTTVLTNAMVFTGERRRRLEQLAGEPGVRDRVTLQVSLDSPTSELHDRHRGDGSFQRVREGLELAMSLGFRVRVAATLGTDAGDVESQLAELFDQLGLAADQRVVRRVAHQGAANAGLVLSRASLVPEVCVTASGVMWHPVAAIDPAMRVRDDWRPLADTIGEITEEFRNHRLRGDVLASTFPCA